jgi:PAS domain S-box-containing protein
MTDIANGLANRILEGSPDAVLISDREGTIRFWNASAERIFGFSSADSIGQSLDIIIPERFRDRHWAGWEKAMATGVTRYDDGRLLAVPALRKDGRQISIEFSIQLLKDSGGLIEWVAAIIRDVTDRYLKEKNLRN